jgi:outer membrane protein assembly factor BamB
MPEPQVQKVACPSCGAPLLFGAGEITTRCTFCHAVVERPLSAGQPAVMKSGPAPRPATVSGSAGTSSAMFIRLMFLLGIAIVAGVLLLALVFVLQDVSPRATLILNGPIIPYPVDRTEGPDFIALAYDIPAENSQFIRLDPVKGRVVWRGKKVEDSSKVRSIAAGDGKFFAVEGTELQAFNAGTGAALWQAKLSDELDYCDECLSVAGNRVIVLTRDYVIQAFDAETGNSAWTRRMFGYTRGFTIADGGLWVIDSVEDVFSLFALSLADGSEQQKITPECIGKNSSWAENLDSISGFFFDPDPSMPSPDRSLYLFYGYRPGCIERREASSDALLWQVADDEGYSPSSEYTMLFTPEMLYFAYDDMLWSVTKDGGAARKLSEGGDYELVPLAYEQNVLILRTKRTRGTAQFGLRGFDPVAGSILWDHPIENSEPVDPPDAAFGYVDEDTSIWAWRFFGDRVQLYDFKSNPSQILFDSLDPKDGSSAGTQALALDISQDSYFGPKILAWENSVIWLVADTKLMAIDLSARKVLYHFP